MSGIFKRFFVKKKQEENSESEDYEFDSSSNPNFLTNPSEINKLLSDIEKSSSLCTISFQGVTEEFSSSILDVQVENQQIILDELIPKHGNELLSKKSEIKLSTIFNGIRLALKLRYVNSGSSRGIAYHKTYFPDRIYYPQRRESPRIQINSLNIPFSGISTRTQSTVGGYIFDLSRSGICISMQDNRARIQRGNTIKDCKISINDSIVFFDVGVRFVKIINPGSSKTLVGGVFENISSKKRTKLEYFIASLEREEIRKRKR